MSFQVPGMTKTKSVHACEGERTADIRRIAKRDYYSGIFMVKLISYRKKLKKLNDVKIFRNKENVLRGQQNYTYKPHFMCLFLLK